MSGGRFEKIIAVAGPVAFFLKMGFKPVKQISEEAVLLQFQLRPEDNK